MTTSNLILSDRTNAIDNQKPNQLTKRDFIKRYLLNFAKEDHKPHYSDYFCFDIPERVQMQGGAA